MVRGGGGGAPRRRVINILLATKTEQSLGQVDTCQPVRQYILMVYAMSSRDVTS